MLVTAFAGGELISKAYQEAMTSGYRFYSFGDAMLIFWRESFSVGKNGTCFIFYIFIKAGYYPYDSYWEHGFHFARAVELGLGVKSPAQIQLITDDAESEAFANKVKDILLKS